jgi:hypothetical protein
MAQSAACLPEAGAQGFTNRPAYGRQGMQIYDLQREKRVSLQKSKIVDLKSLIFTLLAKSGILATHNSILATQNYEPLTTNHEHFGHLNL